MSTFLTQLKWQFVLLQKNNIISISFAVTVIYGLLLFFLREVGNLDKILVALILNDPSIIGYFFIALAIYTEIKYEVLAAVFVSPLSIHQLLISKTLALSIIGVICSLGLTISVRGLDFDIFAMTVGTFGVCLLSALLGLIVLTYSTEFLKFTLMSIPVFLGFVNVPLLEYLGVVKVGFLRYLFPVQGCLDLIDYAVSGTPINHFYAYLSLLLMVPLFYWAAYHRFNTKLVHQ